MSHISQKEYKISISKEELSALPSAGYFGSVVVVENKDDAKAALPVLRKSKIIGFDTETRPTFRKGHTNNVALMQLSTPTECFLFRINKIGLMPEIVQLLEDPEKLKIGLSIHDDFKRLRKTTKFNPGGFVDLQSYVKAFNIADLSLQRIYAILFDERISKGQRLTNWEAEELTVAQQNYAAMDALACVKIYNYLNKGKFLPEESKYRKIIEEEESAHSEND